MAEQQLRDSEGRGPGSGHSSWKQELHRGGVLGCHGDQWPLHRRRPRQMERCRRPVQCDAGHDQLPDRPLLHTGPSLDLPAPHSRRGPPRGRQVVHRRRGAESDGRFKPHVCEVPAHDRPDDGRRRLAHRHRLQVRRRAGEGSPLLAVDVGDDFWPCDLCLPGWLVLIPALEPAWDACEWRDELDVPLHSLLRGHRARLGLRHLLHRERRRRKSAWSRREGGGAEGAGGHGEHDQRSGLDHGHRVWGPAALLYADSQ
mmetsp:Transcript_65321/g.169737  ORF Transcript_65321/g.169737 Transcript_65321/m.169737 type:complete len:257 (+) Transcript_65321:1563-2333(+)